MEKLPKFITDERTGLKYELCGDYYIIAGEDELEREPIGVWGQRHLKYISLLKEKIRTHRLSDGGSDYSCVVRYDRIRTLF